MSGPIATAPNAKLSDRGREGTVGGFDDIIQRRKDASADQSSAIAKLGDSIGSLFMEKAPSSGAEGKCAAKTSREVYDFQREWRQHCTTAKDTLSFLTRTREGAAADKSPETQLVLQPDATCKAYFSTDIDSEIVGDVIEALHLLVPEGKGNFATLDGCCSESNVVDVESVYLKDRSDAFAVNALSSQKKAMSFIEEWVKALASCGRFQLSISFLTYVQRQKLKEICRFMRKSHSNDEGDARDDLFQYDSLLSDLRK